MFLKKKSVVSISNAERPYVRGLLVSVLEFAFFYLSYRKLAIFFSYKQSTFSGRNRTDNVSLASVFGNKKDAECSGAPTERNRL